MNVEWRVLQMGMEVVTSYSDKKVGISLVEGVDKGMKVGRC